MNKKGAIWISAVLYIALGIILISMILAAGLPAVQKMKDKYTVKQTKDLMLVFDENIRVVDHEGPGSQRVIKLKIGRGLFDINEGGNNITWSLNTKVPISEPSSENSLIDVFEGNLKINTIKTAIEKQYKINLILEYGEGIDLELDGDTQSTLSGTFRLSILNTGHEEGEMANVIKLTLI
jgi:hypothetical protein